MEQRILLSGAIILKFSFH
ncbi:LEPR-XLL domain-containing protein [Cylindrospermopsis raciborskii]